MITMKEEENTSLSQSSNDLLTIREVAHLLRVNTTTVRRWIKSGALEAVMLPHQGSRCGYRIRRQTLTLLLSH